MTTTTATRLLTTTTPTATTTPYTKERGGRKTSRKLSLRLYGTVIKIWCLKDNVVTTLTFQSHVT